jgi:hypothetical protein
LNDERLDQEETRGRLFQPERLAGGDVAVKLNPAAPDPGGQ